MVDEWEAQNVFTRSNSLDKSHKFITTHKNELDSLSSMWQCVLSPIFSEPIPFYRAKSQSTWGGVCVVQLTKYFVSCTSAYRWW